MTAPVWRGYGEELALRRFGRLHCLTGSDGLVLEDLDLVARRFCPDVPGDIGRVRLIEHKHGGAELGRSKEMTFGLIDALLRVADPSLRFYEGWFVLRSPKPRGDVDPFADTTTVYQVNSARLRFDELVDWMNFGTTRVAPRPPRQLFQSLIAHLGGRLFL